MCKCSFGDAMHLFKVNDFSVDDDKKKHIYIEAALHCAETAGCFVSDYLIRYLISEAKGVSDLLKNYVFHIVPVVDVSGWRLGLHGGTCKNELKNMNRDFWNICK